MFAVKPLNQHDVALHVVFVAVWGLFFSRALPTSLAQAIHHR